MARKAEQHKSELIDKAAALAAARLSGDKAKAAERFVRLFYANVSPDDLAGETAETLYCSALSLWHHGQKRQPHVAKVRVFNPRADEHGWRSAHTVVEIVNDDMPFLVDSVTQELNRGDLTVHLVIHPIVKVARDGAGMITDAKGGETHDESFMQVRINEQSGGERLDEIKRNLEKVLADVRAAVTDWRAMRAKIAEVAAELDKSPPPLPAAEISEARAFLAWLADDYFTFLGYREYDFHGSGDQTTTSIVAGSGMGILHDDGVSVFDGLRNSERLPPDLRYFLNQSRLLMVTKANRRSTVHRTVQMDTIGIKRFDAKGEVVGERLFVGLFTSSAYARSPRDIPLLRRKVEDCIARAQFDPASHDGKALIHILDSFPRDELFQMSPDELFETALGILHLQERQRIALFSRRDPFERFVSCLVYLPRDRLTTELRLRMQDILAQAYGGKVSAFYTQVTDASLARLHIVIETTPGAIPDADQADLEARLVEAGRSWTDRFEEALIDVHGEERGLGKFRRYASAFPLGYRERFPAETAVFDMERAEEALTQGRLAINLYRPIESPANELRLKLYAAGGQLTLSDVLPTLEHMGLRVLSEMPFQIFPAGAASPVWLHDFRMETAEGGEIDISTVKDVFHEAYARILAGEMEDDGFNRLVLRARLDWRKVSVLRAYAKYLRQAGAAFSQIYMEEALAKNASIARKLYQLFRAIHDPEGQANAADMAKTIQQVITKALDKVTNLDEDRILRRFLNVILATQRTNFFQKAKGYISLKLDSQAIEELPLPRPLVEIWVYSPRVEAVHLRGGRVARGGIRWSDRREDFRTEVLGLMKAQMVKNAVIVPVGSKGGFVVKRPPVNGSREAIQAEGIECYKTMMRGLLDITDNLVLGKLKPPADVVRLDEDDPYLVVAADKGTATFSDIANSVSAEYGFWLGDAFASGGSAGYDHKKMAITARGAWESVKRHFREIGTDIQQQPFSVVGVGDMSGDVFGNGMLLSPRIRLLAAFNHLHIFIDPDPDPAASLAERQRLFDLPRSAWSDYDPKLISAGGAIYERRAKSIRLSPEARKVLGIERESLAPNDLIKLLLKAEIDLLWLGGIGTYVKAHDETNVEVGDRANDGLRVDGRDLRCKVVGEGANLGFTQRGRVEAAMAGRRMNTDAMDNSAGVDCSDHEVNIKIPLNELVTAGDMTLKQRDKLLVSMTDEVGTLVLRDNYLQTQALSVAELQGWYRIDQQGRFMRALERAGKLDRAIEFLPDDEIIKTRLAHRQGLTRPELAVLFAYSKMTLYEELLPSDLPDDAQLVDDLIHYFPAELAKAHGEALPRHRLRREIIATVVTNSLVNRVGSTFVHVMKEKTGMAASDIARAYAICRGVFELRALWADIQALDNKVPAVRQYEMLDATIRLAETGTLWCLRNLPPPLDIAANIATFSPGVAELQINIDTLVTDGALNAMKQRVERFTKDGVPEALAQRVARLDLLASSLDIVRLARATNRSMAQVGGVYFNVGRRFHVDWLRSATTGVNLDSHWDRLALAAIIEDLYGHQRDLAANILQHANGADPDVDAWIAGRPQTAQRVETLIADLRQLGGLDLAKLAVANRELRSLSGG
jgi:glutamate dehydrogenase